MSRTTTFERVLIANRGEIAVRIARACREAGIESVAVYSDADAGSPHVLASDRAIRIGPAPATESYLSIPAILAAAASTGAEAIHPGYGFLSQNAAFARACEQAGVTFIGPPASVLDRMGSKIEARRLMTSSGVPVVPGEIPEDQSDAGVAGALERVGLPAFVKASAGGGGKGLRIVRTMDAAAEEIRAARREALAAFADGSLFVERLIDRPKHIEVQVMADAHGNVVHLFERECSIQRRHQKVIEESPSPSIGPGLRARLAAAAVAAARAAGYRNAGTVEFLVDQASDGSDDAPLYFLEMNTRLQVEHGVTELVCGVDLVRAQLAVAAGQPLPWGQDDIAQRGHAIQARLYAEDPAKGFLPQAGPVLLCREPHAPGIRIDSGIAEGQVITPHYDPLLAKVMAWAENRTAAIARLSQALRQYPVLGLTTNGPFLLRVLEDGDFTTGNVHTGWLDARQDLLRDTNPPELPSSVLAAVGALEEDTGTSPRGTDSPADPWATLRSWRG
ncbi:MAG: acetyl/propionyl/methylcrotonyl-CoA carboxylase subunit alpha [Vicinamibacterales bacterium]